MDKAFKQFLQFSVHKFIIVINVKADIVKTDNLREIVEKSTTGD